MFSRQAEFAGFTGEAISTERFKRAESSLASLSLSRAMYKRRKWREDSDIENDRCLIAGAFFPLYERVDAAFNYFQYSNARNVVARYLLRSRLAEKTRIVKRDNLIARVQPEKN